MANREMTPPKPRRNRPTRRSPSFPISSPRVISRYAISATVLVSMLIIGYILYIPYAWAMDRLFAMFGPKFFPDSRLHAPAVLPGEYTVTLKHFSGAEDCGIKLSDIYDSEGDAEPGIGGHKAFCDTRLQFLEAITWGMPITWGIPTGNKAFEGLGCTWRFFPTVEVCMILERFSSLTFVGDGRARRIYMGLNILLREDLALGALQDWQLGLDEKESCRCQEQFKEECTRFAIMRSAEFTADGRREYFCKGPPHVYLPLTGLSSLSSPMEEFKTLAFSKSHPREPNPIIFSLTAYPLSDSASTIRILKEWRSLVFEAKRNVPILVVGPESTENSELSKGQGNEEVEVGLWMEQMEAVKTEMHFDLMGTYNLTRGMVGLNLEERLAIVEAMMVVNWLARLQAP